LAFAIGSSQLVLVLVLVILIDYCNHHEKPGKMKQHMVRRPSTSTIRSTSTN
jgi:hypothetical protein